MAKTYIQQHRLLPSCLALITALAPLGWSQELHAQERSQVPGSTAAAQGAIDPEIMKLVKQANELRQAGNYGVAAAIWAKILAWAELNRGPEHPDVAAILCNLAGLYIEQGAYTKAEPLCLRALVINERVLGRDHPSTAASLGILAGLYRAQGSYAKAELFYLRALAIHEKALGSEHPDTARSLHNLAELYRAQDAYVKAEPLYLRALAIHEKALGSEHLYTAASLHNLAELYRAQGAYVKAEPLYLRALAIHEKALGSEHPDTATSLGSLAELYRAQGAYVKAEPLYLRALAIHEKALGSEHPDTATSLRSLAELYRAQGAYAKAEPLYLRALAIHEKALGSEHPDTATSLGSLAELYRAQGAYAKAEPLYLRALAIHEKTLGSEHRDTAISLNGLAALYESQGLYSKAEPFYLRALAIFEKALGGEHPDTATSLNNLALLYVHQGLYSRAEPLYLRTLSIYQAVLGGDHPSIATSLNNLALLYVYQGLYGRAEPLYLRALSIYQVVLGSEHPDGARSLDNLAYLYSVQGAYDKAEPLYLRALAIREKGLGSEHPDTARSLGSLAYLYSAQGSYGKAELFYLRALAIHKKALGSEHPYAATNLHNLASLYQGQGLYSKAAPLYLRALAIFEKVLGSDHPSTTTSLNNLAELYRAQGAYGQAKSYLLRGLTIETRFLQQEAPFLSVNARQDLLRSMGAAHEAAFSFADREVGSAELALFSRINRQGLLAEIEQRQTQLAALPGPQREAADELRALNTKLSAATLTAPQRQTLRTRQEELEQQLYRQLPALKPRLLQAGELAAALPVGGALVEFQRFRPFDVRKPKDQRWGPPRYLALILRPDQSITSIPLGPAAPIEAAIHRALQASAEDTSDAQALWGQLSDLVLKPLAPALAGSNQWFFSPDAELNRVPFAALPSPQDPARPLGQAIKLRMLTTGRDLLRLEKPAKPAQMPVVVANPSFDRGGVVARAASSQRRSADLAAKAWSPLSASAREGQRIGTLLATSPITGAAASTLRLQQLQAPRVLHIATHGFFVGDAETKPSDSLFALQDNSAMLRAFRGEDPQLRSGLVLAGANQPDADPSDDGYLTAAEAVALRLDGTELVVLSACSTGQGEIRTGEGVYGLQRALTVAGARSTLLSLWKVDDAATAEFMGRFYSRLKAGEGRMDALVAVQAEFRNGLVRGPQGEDWSAPFYWAAWQLVGDWRPIQAL